MPERSPHQHVEAGFERVAEDARDGRERCDERRPAGGNGAGRSERAVHRPPPAEQDDAGDQESGHRGHRPRQHPASVDRAKMPCA